VPGPDDGEALENVIDYVGRELRAMVATVTLVVSAGGSVTSNTFNDC